MLTAAAADTNLFTPTTSALVSEAEARGFNIVTRSLSKEDLRVKVPRQKTARISTPQNVKGSESLDSLHSTSSSGGGGRIGSRSGLPPVPQSSSRTRVDTSRKRSHSLRGRRKDVSYDERVREAEAIKKQSLLEEKKRKAEEREEKMRRAADRRAKLQAIEDEQTRSLERAMLAKHARSLSTSSRGRSASPMRKSRSDTSSLSRSGSNEAARSGEVGEQTRPRRGNSPSLPRYMTPTKNTRGSSPARRSSSKGKSTSKRATWTGPFPNTSSLVSKERRGSGSEAGVIRKSSSTTSSKSVKGKKKATSTGSKDMWANASSKARKKMLQSTAIYMADPSPAGGRSGSKKKKTKKQSRSESGSGLGSGFPSGPITGTPKGAPVGLFAPPSGPMPVTSSSSSSYSSSTVTGVPTTTTSLSSSSSSSTTSGTNKPKIFRRRSSSVEKKSVREILTLPSQPLVTDAVGDGM